MSCKKLQWIGKRTKPGHHNCVCVFTRASFEIQTCHILWGTMKNSPTSLHTICDDLQKNPGSEQEAAVNGQTTTTTTTTTATGWWTHRCGQIYSETQPRLNLPISTIWYQPQTHKQTQTGVLLHRQWEHYHYHLSDGIKEVEEMEFICQYSIISQHFWSHRRLDEWIHVPGVHQGQTHTQKTLVKTQTDFTAIM